MTLCTPWIEIDDRLADCGCPSDASAEVVQAAIDTATDILFRLSGQQYPGLCTESRRPCRTATSCGCASFHLCTCVGGDTIVLPRRNVVSVDSVRIDGLPFTDFVFYPPNWLVRTDGEYWPCCQDLTLDTTHDGTWSVTYTYGRQPTEGAKNAARVLSAELVKACVSDASCRIPIGAVSVTRRGVTYDTSAQDEGKTGISEVDLWLSAVNPGGRKRRPRLVSPDDTRWVPDLIVGS